jgi:hypothetical protein
VSQLADIGRLVNRAAALGPIDALVNVADVGRVHSVMAHEARRWST